MKPDDIQAIRDTVKDMVDQIKAVVKSLGDDMRNPAVCLRVDLGHVLRELDRCDTQLVRVQDYMSDRWSEDLEAGAIG